MRGVSLDYLLCFFGALLGSAYESPPEPTQPTEFSWLSLGFHLNAGDARGAGECGGAAE